MSSVNDYSCAGDGNHDHTIGLTHRLIAKANANDSIGRDIFGDYRSGGNNGIVTDGHSLQDGYICAKPHFFADVYRFSNHTCPLRRVRKMIERAERSVMPDEGIVVNEDTESGILSGAK